MTTVKAGSRVSAGYYFGLRSWSLHAVSAAGERLPGSEGETYARIPTFAAFLLAPVLGAVFLVFLPLVGFVLTAVAAAGPVMRLGRRIATGFAATVEPGWEPGHAHLTGKRVGHGERAEAARREEDPLDELEHEIAVLRAARRVAR